MANKVNVEHILGDEENLERLPAKIRKAKNLPLLLETAVELARRKVVVEPGLVTAQGYMGRCSTCCPFILRKWTTRPCNDTYSNGRVLFRQYLSDA